MAKTTTESWSFEQFDKVLADAGALLRRALAAIASVEWHLAQDRTLRLDVARARICAD